MPSRPPIKTGKNPLRFSVLEQASEVGSTVPPPLVLDLPDPADAPLRSAPLQVPPSSPQPAFVDNSAVRFAGEDDPTDTPEPPLTLPTPVEAELAEEPVEAPSPGSRRDPRQETRFVPAEPLHFGPVSPKAAAPSKPGICPKCAAPRSSGDTCPRCGIVYARYRLGRHRRRPQESSTLLGWFFVVIVVASTSWAMWRFGPVRPTAVPVAGVGAPTATAPPLDLVEALTPTSEPRAALEPDDTGKTGHEPDLAPMGLQAMGASGPVVLGSSSSKGRVAAIAPPTHPRVVRFEEPISTPAGMGTARIIEARGRVHDPVLVYSLVHIELPESMPMDGDLNGWLESLASWAVVRVGGRLAVPRALQIPGRTGMEARYRIAGDDQPETGKLRVYRLGDQDAAILMVGASSESTFMDPVVDTFFNSVLFEPMAGP